MESFVGTVYFLLTSSVTSLLSLKQFEEGRKKGDDDDNNYDDNDEKRTRRNYKN